MTLHSDLPIPRLTDILDRALDLRGSAVRLQDTATVRQIDQMTRKLPDARLCWVLGTLHVDSPSGGRYQVTRAGCSCPNGQKSHARACWHWALHSVLLDLFDTQCETADMEADPPGDNPLGDSEGDPEPPDRPRSLGWRLCMARAAYL